MAWRTWTTILASASSWLHSGIGLSKPMEMTETPIRYWLCVITCTLLKIMVLYLLYINKIMMTVSSPQKPDVMYIALFSSRLYSATLFVRDVNSSSLFTELTQELRHPVLWELGATKNLNGVRPSLSFHLLILSGYQVHRHPKQRPLFFYSDWRYEEMKTFSA